MQLSSGKDLGCSHGRAFRRGAEGEGLQNAVRLSRSWVWRQLVDARPEGPRGDLTAAREACIEALREGSARFPLSEVHYQETWAHPNSLKRGKIAAEMAVLSRFLTLRAWDELRLAEIEASVCRIFERRPLRGSADPYGFGCAHALGFPAPEPPPGQTAEDAFLNEWIMLWSPNEDQFAEHNAARRRNSQRFAQAEDGRRREWSEFSASSDFAKRFRISAGFGDFDREFIGMLIGHDIPVDEFASLGADGYEALVRDAPTVWVFTELRRLRYGDLAHPFKVGDLHDLRALAVAVVHCNVVLPDGAWREPLNRSGLAASFGTVVAANLEEVGALLELEGVADAAKSNAYPSRNSSKHVPAPA